MRKQIKSIFAVALSAAMVVSLGSAAGVKQASAEETTDSSATEKQVYHAYLGFQAPGSPDWLFRNPCEDVTYGLKSKDYDYLTQYCGSDSGKKDATITNADITEDGTYTISIDNIDLSKQDNFNMVYITTDIPASMKGVEFTNVKYSVDGEVVATQEKGEQKSDNKKYYMMMTICMYPNPAEKVNEAISTILPKKSISITFDVKGIDFETSYEAVTVGLAKGKTFTKDGVTYKVTTASTSVAGKVTNGKVQAIGFDKKATTAKVADTVKNGDATYTLSSLKAGAFKGASKLTAVTLGKKVKSIGKDTFVNCKKLKTVTFGVKLSSVTKNSFKGCKTIKVKGTSAAANKKLLAKQNKTVKFN